MSDLPQRRSSIQSDERSGPSLNASATDSRTSSMFSNNAIQASIYSLLNLYRIRTHWLYYNFFHIFFLIQAIPVLFPYEVPYGRVFNYSKSVFDRVLYIRTLGLQHAPIIVFKVLTVLVLVAYLVALLLFVLSYRLYQQGNTQFARVKTILVSMLAVVALFAMQVLYNSTIFWDCTNGKMSLFRNESCWQGSNAGWGVVALLIVFLQVIYSAVTVFSICVTSVGKNGCFFSTENVGFFMWEHMTYVILVAIRSATKKLPFMRPILACSQAALSLVILFVFLPFYNRRANSFYAGVAMGRFLGTFTVFITALVNKEDESKLGIAMSVVAISLLFSGFAIGFAAMELYQFLIIRWAQQYEDVIKGTVSQKKINMRILNAYVKLTMSDNKRRPKVEKLMKLCSLYGVESEHLHVTQAVLNIYYNTTNPKLAYQSLAKAIELRPNIFLKFVIYSRYKDLEDELGEEQDIRKISQTIVQARKKKKNYLRLVVQFWKELVATQVDSGKLEVIARKASTCFEEAERIYNNMLSLYPKKPNVLRAYSEFSSEMLWDTDLSNNYLHYAEELEEQEQIIQQTRKRAFVGNENLLSIFPKSTNTVAPIDHSTPVDSRSDTDSTASNDCSKPNADVPYPLNETNALVKFDEHRKSIDLKMDDLDEADQIDYKTTEQKKRDSIVSLIRRHDPVYIFRICILSIGVATILYLAAIIAINMKGMNHSDIKLLESECRFQSANYEVLNIWRQAQINYSANQTEGEIYGALVPPAVSLFGNRLLKSLNKAAEAKIYVPSNLKKLLLVDKYVMKLPVIGGNETWYDANMTLYDIGVDFGDSMIRFSRDWKSKTDNEGFLTLWGNRDSIASSFSRFCDEALRTFTLTVRSERNSLIAIGIVTAAFHLFYYAIVFFPALVLFLRKKKGVLKLFHGIPRETLGKVYHSLEEQVKDSHHSSSAKSLDPKYKILSTLLLIWALELACVCVLAYDSFSKVFSVSGAPEVIRNSGLAVRRVNQIVFDVAEVTVQDYSLKYDIVNGKRLIPLRIAIVKDSWNSMRFGTNTKSQKGVQGNTPAMDTLINNNTCIDSSMLKFGNSAKFDCISLNGLFDEIVSRANWLLRRYELLSKTEILFHVNELYEIMFVLNFKLDLLISNFTNYSASRIGLQFPLIYAFLIGFVMILIMYIPLYLAVSSDMSVSHQMRRMLYYLPTEVLESVPEINQFIVSFQLKKRKSKKEEGNKTRAILDASTDSILLCTESGTIIDWNTMTKSMFQMDESDLVGLNIKGLFNEDIEQAMVEMLKSARAITKEYTGKKKNGNPFPAKVSISTGVWEKKTVIAIFCRDTTIEQKQNQLLQEEKQHSDQLLLNILPIPVANRLKRGETLISDEVPDVTCFFSDMVGFTKLSSGMTASALVELLNEVVNNFDDICTRHRLEKIKTIGDAYFAVGGLHGGVDIDHPERVVRFGLDIIDSLKKFEGKVQIRCGCHTGPIVAGVIGKTKFAYDVWGDTVNVAARMEQNSEPGRVMCSRATYERCHDLFYFTEKNNISVKGKGNMTCYVVTGEKVSRRYELERTEQTVSATELMKSFSIGTHALNPVHSPKRFRLDHKALSQYNLMMANEMNKDGAEEQFKLNEENREVEQQQQQQQNETDNVVNRDKGQEQNETE